MHLNLSTKANLWLLVKALILSRHAGCSKEWGKPRFNPEFSLCSNQCVSLLVLKVEFWILILTVMCSLWHYQAVFTFIVESIKFLCALLTSQIARKLILYQQSAHTQVVWKHEAWMGWTGSGQFNLRNIKTLIMTYFHVCLRLSSLDWIWFTTTN